MSGSAQNVTVVPVWSAGSSLDRGRSARRTGRTAGTRARCGGPRRRGGGQGVDDGHARRRAGRRTPAYPPPPNLPPACRTVSTTSTAGLPSLSTMSTGIPRPSSMTRTPPSASRVIDDLARVTGQGLVDGVVDHLVDEVVQTPLTGGADVHAGALANRVQTLENRDRAGVVGHGRRASFKGSEHRLMRAPMWVQSTLSGGHRSPRHGAWGPIRAMTPPPAITRTPRRR